MINTKKSKKDSPNILLNICFFLYYSSRKIKKLFRKSKIKKYLCFLEKVKLNLKKFKRKSKYNK